MSTSGKPWDGRAGTITLAQALDLIAAYWQRTEDVPADRPLLELAAYSTCCEHLRLGLSQALWLPLFAALTGRTPKSLPDVHEAVWKAIDRRSSAALFLATYGHLPPACWLTKKSRRRLPRACDVTQPHAAPVHHCHLGAESTGRRPAKPAAE
ncbi:MAG: hypothetical protein JO247_15590 [Chloroflexi bacterium]|nr:hypothetical protein [Chloroflexota bacterium]